MCCALGGDTARPQALGQSGELRGCSFGHLCGSLSGFQPSRIGENRAQHLERWKVTSRGRLVLNKIGQVECEHLLQSVGIIGMDLEAIKVTYDQQRRVFQVFAILKQLLIRLVEVFVFPFVLPCEISALPHVSEAITPGSLLGTFLESVGASVLISFRRGLLAKEFAKLIEM